MEHRLLCVLAPFLRGEGIGLGEVLNDHAIGSAAEPDPQDGLDRVACKQVLVDAARGRQVTCSRSRLVEALEHVVEARVHLGVERGIDDVGHECTCVTLVDYVSLLISAAGAAGAVAAVGAELPCARCDVDELGVLRR